MLEIVLFLLLFFLLLTWRIIINLLVVSLYQSYPCYLYYFYCFLNEYGNHDFITRLSIVDFEAKNCEKIPSWYKQQLEILKIYQSVNKECIGLFLFVWMIFWVYGNQARLTLSIFGIPVFILHLRSFLFFNFLIIWVINMKKMG